MADHNDRTHIPGQRQESPADDGQALSLQKPPAPKPWRTALREKWEAAWSEGGVLHARWEDLRLARVLGWHSMANWIKTVLALIGASILIAFLDGAAGILADALHRLLTAAPRVQIGTDNSTGVVAVVDQRVRSYLAQHSAGLAVSASTLYTLWQVAGMIGLIFGYLRSTAARLLWAAWGASSAAMIWSATPATSRPIAVGLAVLAWTVLSAFAMRGLTLRRRVGRPARPARVSIKPEIHVHVPAPAPAPAVEQHPHSGCPFRD
ncbi:hypothetical protein [Streptomyces scabiei]|uniref:hypothetical protein n=1 Tax=Streptomyces scabiei TaxID=1930 RepID=UPI000629C598|nr:hypothetical protein [Streptomyces scabiei]MDX2835467.1 hypothetical protein [Streptomyces scabiei]MDX3680489.1 hypothetical protein [Streptomyces scabiei]